MSKIDDIMDTFDFAKVRKAMVALDWKWAFCDEVLEEYELRKHARMLLKEADRYGNWQKRDCTMGIGGFQVRYYHPSGELKLQFVLEEQWSE